MNLAINGKFTSRRLSGVERVAYEYTFALQRILQDSQQLSLIVPANATMQPLPANARVVSRWLKGNMWEQLALLCAVREKTLISFCNVGPLLRRRHIVMIHDMAVYDVPGNYSRMFRLWYRFAFAILKRNAGHILTVSEFSKGRIVAQLGVPESRVSVIHSGVDHFDRIESDASIVTRLGLVGRQYVLIVGSLQPGKNLSRVLAAMERLDPQRDVRFVIAGGVNARVFSVGEAPRSQSDRAIWAGVVTDGELKALYQNAACFVFASLYEGFGLPPLEAMHCGCPVVVSREASLPEICGDAALYCDARSVEDIAEKIDRMLSDAQLREVYRERGRDRARQYRWDTAARRLLGALRSCMHEAPP